MMKWRDSQLQVLWLARVDYSRNSGIRKHSHDFYQLLQIIDGQGTIEIEGQSYPVLSNHCYLFNKGIAHGFHFTEDTITFDVKFAMAEPMEACLASREWSGGVPVRHLDRLKELFRLSSDNLKQSHPLLPFRIDIGFKAIILDLIYDNDSPHAVQPLTPPVGEAEESFPMVQYLKQNLSAKVSLEQMAEHFNFNPHYLIERFKRNLGTTPMKYLQSLRLEKAREYLEFTSYSVSEIAELVGLTPPYFSRLCLERFGMPPIKIREQMRTVVGKDIILEEDFSIEAQPTITTNAEDESEPL